MGHTNGVFTRRSGQLLAACMTAAMLAGCGGGGSSSSSSSSGGGSGGGSTSGISLTGIVASGAPVINGVGYALDAATGQHVNFTTDSTGTYSVNLGTRTGPFLLHVIGFTAAGAPVDMYSLASNAGGTANITPLSNVVLAYAGGATTQSLEAACTGNVANCPTLMTTVLGNLSTANTAVISAIPANVLTNFGLSNTTLNAVTTPFTVNHTGLDALLDALLVAPPTATNANYQLSLAGTNATQLATVPISGTAGTQSTSTPTAGSAASTTALTQATNLATAEGEAMATFANLGALYATSMPAAATVQNYIDNSLGSLLSGSAFTGMTLTSGNAIKVGSVLSGGSLAAYSGAPFTGTAPAAAVTYDANNCVTSMWVHFVINGGSTHAIKLDDAIPSTNAPGVCTGGTWTMAGNGRHYDFGFNPSFWRYTNNAGYTQYSAGIGLYADPAYSTQQGTATNLWSTVTITGPGLATAGTPNATTGTVTLIAPTSSQTWASINDLHYGTAAMGSNQLQACTDLPAVGTGNVTNSTPCFNTYAMAGSDYTIQFRNGTTVLETDMNRLHVTMSAAIAPLAYFPGITAVTPAASTITTAGATVTTTYTLPAGAANAGQFIQVFDAMGNSLSRVEANNVATTSSSNTLSTGTLTTGAATGLSAVYIELGEFTLGSEVSF